MKYIQSKIKFIFFSCFILIFTGCSQAAFKYFDKKEEFIQNVQYTKILKFVEKDIVKAIATITYLNSADSKKWDNGKQNFIISVYIIDKDKKNYKVDLTLLKEKEIQLNKIEREHEKVIVYPMKQSVISKSDPLYDIIPLRNGWAEYQLVSYDNKEFKDVKSFTFKFKDKNNHAMQKSVTFTKE